MIVIRKIDHIVLRTENPDDLIAFYRDVLGCAVERQLGKEVGLTQLRAGECLIDIVDVKSELGRTGGGAPTSGANNLDHFCLQVEPFDEAALIRYLQEKQIATTEFVTRYGAQGNGRSIYIEDPDGNTVELRAAKSGG